VYRRWPVFSLPAVLLFAAVSAGAHEPDGRFVLRYAWKSDRVPGSTRPLSVTLTSVVAVKDVRISAGIPPAALVNIRSLRVAGAQPLAPTEGRWPDAGVALGDLPAGATVVFDLDVVEPSAGGGILAIGVDGRLGDRVVHEGEGISLGRPGLAPTIRDGVAEFPAEPGGRAP
jgi:hypothetical protein